MNREKTFNILRTAVAMLAAILVAFLIIILVSDKPVESILIFLMQPFSSGRYVGNIVETAIPLIFSGLSMAILFQAGLFNLGGEGVFFMAGIVGSIAAIWLKLPIFIFPLVCLAVGAGTGILVMLVPGALRAKFNANEMVTSLMMNNICYGVGCYILNNMMRDTAVSSLVSYKYRSAALLPTIVSGTRVHVGILIALLCAAMVYVFLYKTKWGLQVRATGANAKFAKYSGMNVMKVILLVHVIAGAVAGCGGIVECIIKGMPAGIGEPCFEKLSANLAKAVCSIGAVKGFEIGNGFETAKANGSTNNDFFYKREDGTVGKKTNHAGGILGGISDGSDILFRAAFKPTPSISSSQQTVSTSGEKITVSVGGRHDPIIVPRAVVVVECMAALTALDMLMISMTSRLDLIKDFFGQ